MWIMPGSVKPQVNLKSSDLLSVGELSARSGVAASALRFYEAQGLIASVRSSGNQRRYPRHILRRVAFIRAGQALGVPLGEIGAALATLPDGRTPTKADWERLAGAWLPLLDARLAALTQLRAKLTGCIGCGCLSMTKCALYNAQDEAAAQGSGARNLRPLPPVQP